MAKTSYMSYIRNRWPLAYAHSWAWGPTRKKQIVPWVWGLVLMTRYRGKEGWHYNRRDVLSVGHRAIRFFLTRKNLDRFERAVRKRGQSNIRFAQKIRTKQWGQASLSELHNTFQAWFDIFCDFAAPMLTLDATDEVLESMIRQEVARSHLPLRAPDFAALLTPDAETYIQKEMRDFRRLVVRYRRAKSTKARGFLLARHIHHWWWKDLGWGQFLPMDRATLLKNLRSSPSVLNITTLNRKEIHERQKTLRKKRTLARTFPKKLQNLLVQFEVLAALHDYRKEVQMKMMYAGMTLVKEIARQRRIPSPLTTFLLPRELLAASEGKSLDLRAMKKRLQNFWCATTPRGVQLLVGSSARKKIERAHLYEETKGDTLFLQGIGASPGKVTGRVRVGLESRVVNRAMMDGEILVTGQTSPDFLPAMKRALAVITDEGGITSHAAIVSRELGIPCVIGTKAATQFLSTGDIVDVNANHGTIKILKRA